MNKSALTLIENQLQQFHWVHPKSYIEEFGATPEGKKCRWFIEGTRLSSRYIEDGEELPDVVIKHLIQTCAVTVMAFEAWHDQQEKVKLYINNIKSVVERYPDSSNLYEDLNNEIQKQVAEQYDNRVSVFVRLAFNNLEVYIKDVPEVLHIVKVKDGYEAAYYAEGNRSNMVNLGSVGYTVESIASCALSFIHQQIIAK